MSTASPITLPDSPLVWTVDAAAVTKRNLYRYIRVPTLLLFSTIQPVMFVLLFTYVFGGSIRVPGVDHYVDYLISYLGGEPCRSGMLVRGMFERLPGVCGPCVSRQSALTVDGACSFDAPSSTLTEPRTVHAVKSRNYGVSSLNTNSGPWLRFTVQLRVP